MVNAKEYLQFECSKCLILYIDEDSAERCCVEEEDLFDKSEDKNKCGCGYEVEEGSEGCGECIEEWTKEDEDGTIIDHGWYHCGENGMLCDGCKEKKHDAFCEDSEVKKE